MVRSPSLENLKRRLDAIPEAVREAVKPALLRSGNELAGEMRTLAEPSRKTGALIESIAVTGPGETTPPHSQPGGSTVVPDNAVMVTVGDEGVRYAHLVEFGTVHSAAEPFFLPAYRLLKPKIQRRLKRAIGKAVRDKWKPTE